MRDRSPVGFVSTLFFARATASFAPPPILLASQSIHDEDGLITIHDAPINNNQLQEAEGGAHSAKSNAISVPSVVTCDRRDALRAPLNAVRRSCFLRLVSQVVIAGTCAPCHAFFEVEERNERQVVVERTLPRDFSWSRPAYDATEIRLPTGERLCLPTMLVPKTVPVPIDGHLGTIVELENGTKMLLGRPPVALSSVERSGRVLNICQGEIGHASVTQCDVIASGDATVCHILAVRSTGRGPSEPLASLAHVDRAGYEDSLRDMVKAHKDHHSRYADASDRGWEDNKGERIGRSETITMDVHIMGGYNDKRGASREISEFLMDLLARLAFEERHSILMTLRSCAVASLNDDGRSRPIGRGLGLDLTTGKAFLASVVDDAKGPAIELRSARIWTEGPREQLAVVHTAGSGVLSVSPFRFRRFRGMGTLLSLSDEALLEETSTSPEVEADDYCDRMRQTLLYIGNHNWREVFGERCNLPVRYRRCHDGISNEWRSVGLM